MSKTNMDVPDEYQPTLSFFFILMKLKIVTSCWTDTETASKAIHIQMKYWRGLTIN